MLCQNVLFNFTEHQQQCRIKPFAFMQEECRVLISACMARGNAPLALSIYGTMCRVALGSSTASAERHLEQVAWPPATLETVSAVVCSHTWPYRLSFAESFVCASDLPELIPRNAPLLLSALSNLFCGHSGDGASKGAPAQGCIQRHSGCQASGDPQR